MTVTQFIFYYSFSIALNDFGNVINRETAKHIKNTIIFI